MFNAPPVAISLEHKTLLKRLLLVIGIGLVVLNLAIGYAIGNTYDQSVNVSDLIFLEWWGTVVVFWSMIFINEAFTFKYFRSRFNQMTTRIFVPLALALVHSYTYVYLLIGIFDGAMSLGKILDVAVIVYGLGTLLAVLVLPAAFAIVRMVRKIWAPVTE